MVWVIGKDGLLGSHLARMLCNARVPYVASGRELDVCDEKKLFRFADKNAPAFVVNCAAYTDVDKAEDEPEAALQINGLAVRTIAELTKKIGAVLIHISTDCVFDGCAVKAYTENDTPNPQTIYGITKLFGEECVRSIHPLHYIIRTSWLYGNNGRNFFSTMIRLMNERNALEVTQTQRGSPTYVNDLAGAIMSIIQNDGKKYGTYHYSNEGNVSRYDFACEIYKQGRRMNLIHGDCSILPAAECLQKARRPVFSVLDTTKIKEGFGLPIYDWKERLHAYMMEYALSS